MSFDRALGPLAAGGYFGDAQALQVVQAGDLLLGLRVADPVKVRICTKKSGTPEPPAFSPSQGCLSAAISKPQHTTSLNTLFLSREGGGQSSKTRSWPAEASSRRARSSGVIDQPTAPTFSSM